jgi:hypothetical protein|nr:MAG TPA: hypothetical protein [Caudoviricetes sp.]
MERLTEKHYLGTDHYMKCSGNCNVDMDCIDCPSFDRLVERLAAYEDTGLEPEEVNDAVVGSKLLAKSQLVSAFGIAAERLRELAEADKDGRLVALPCKVGDIVWANLDEMRHTRKCVIEFVNIGSRVTTIVFSAVDGLREQYGVNPISFGKTVFLTREEAEKALEAMKDG